jgi:hypothetical protein
MPSLTANDRISLCLFSFTDGRRCRTPRSGNHPHFCFYHAQKESQARAAESLAKDLATFFSGDYLSACDLSAAMARLIPAVIRGDIKPRLARTVAYMFQTQLQAIHLSQNEYINAFGTDTWRKALRSSVNVNYDYRFPSNPNPAANTVPPEPSQSSSSPSPSPTCHPERSEGPCPNPAASITDETHHPTTTRPSPTAHDAALSTARNLFPERPATKPIQSESPATQPADPTPTPKPPTPRRQPGAPTRDPYTLHFDHNYRLTVDGKPW